VSIEYDERIRMPPPLSATIALFPTILLWGLAVLMLAHVSGEAIGLAQRITLFVPAWGLMTLIVHRGMGVTLQIRVRRDRQGQAQPVLQIRGTRKGELARIPLSSIESVDPVRFETNWGFSSVPEPGEAEPPPASPQETSWWKRFLAIRDPDSPVVTATYAQYAYHGPGIRITYRAPTLFSARELRWRLQFPTRHPQKLMSVLRVPGS